MSTIPPVQGAPAPGVVRSTEPESDRARVETEAADVRAVPEESRQKVLESLERRGDRITFGARTAEFTYNRELDRVVVTVFSSDSEPREVVRQIPPEMYLSFVSKFREMLGILFDGKY